jgi:hypothetical protein
MFGENPLAGRFSDRRCLCGSELTQDIGNAIAQSVA